MTKTTPSYESVKFLSGEIQPRVDSVSLRMRQLEQYVALTLAGLTTWIGTVSPGQNAWAVWGAVGLALVVHAWCRFYPAPKPYMLLLRATLLLGMALVVQLQPGQAMASHPFFFWTLIVVVGYTVLLHRRWAMAVIGLGLLQYVGVALLQRPAAWSDWLTSLGMLVAAVGLAWRFAWSFQRTDRELEASFKDPETGLYNSTGLMAHGAQLMAANRREKEPICMTVLQSPNVMEVSNILGRQAVRQLLSDAIKGLLASAKLSRLGLVARTDSGEFVLLLPGIDLPRAKSLLLKQLGSPPRLVLNVRDSEAVIFLHSATLQASPEHNTPESLYESVRSLLDIKREKLNRRMTSQWEASSQLPDSAADISPAQAASVAPKARWRPYKTKPEQPPAKQEVDSSLMSRLEPHLTLPMPLKKQP
jgi:GGDEF domain-containing protein